MSTKHQSLTIVGEQGEATLLIQRDQLYNHLLLLLLLILREGPNNTHLQNVTS